MFCSNECRYKQSQKGGIIYFDKTGIPSQMKGISIGKGRPSPKKGRINTLTPEQSRNMSEGIKKGLRESQKNKEREESGIHTGGKCKLFFIDGYLIQGRYELYYFLTNRQNIISNPKRIKTPFGFYTPDFELQNEFVDIKSTYTITTEMSKKQQPKIKWVSENIKNVKVLIIDGNVVHKFLNKIDCNKFLYDKNKHIINFKEIIII